MNVLCITQARTGSTRLPGKVLKTVGDKTLLEIHLERISRAGRIDKLLVATTTEKEDEKILDVAGIAGVEAVRGSVNDVLDRFYQAARAYRPEWVVRITSDCPLIDPQLADQVIAMAVSADADYCSNTLEPSFPDGMDVEVFKFAALETAWREARLSSDREHVTPYISRNSSFKGGTLFKSASYAGKEDFGRVRLTVDEPEDLEVIRQLTAALGTGATWRQYAEHYMQHSLYTINAKHPRNEGYLKSKKNDDQQL